MSARDTGTEFYVGYLPAAPPRLSKFLRTRVAVLIVVGIAVAVALTVAHGLFGAGQFEYGVVRRFEGIIVARPYPLLSVTRPGQPLVAAASSAYLLVAPGKFGAAPLVDEFDGAHVQLEGSLVWRDGRTLIEVVPGSLQRQSLASSSSAVLDAELDLGVHTLRGEIVDSKCFLGVMNPGELRPHRECAVRCISGGIPPALVVRDAAGHATYLLLVSADGHAVNREVLDLVAEPVEITGRVTRQRDLLQLRSNPDTYRRLTRRDVTGGN